MKNQLKTVNEIAKLTGITIRTLHYYDEIDLLKPSNTSEGGYRLYSNSDIESNIIAKQKEYHREILQRFQNTEAYKEFELKESKSNNEFTDIDKKAREIFGEIAENMNYPPSDEKVQKLISMWQQFITQNYYNCTNEMLQCLALMYVKDERFSSYINSLGDNLSQYISEAINLYCQTK